MSQQEFYPEQSQGQPPRDDEIYYPPQPYHWSTRPKEEEASTNYDESMMQQGYRAQDGASNAQQQGSATNTRSQQAQRQQFGPDGDAFEYGYRGYRSSNMQQQQGVPSWARAQPQRRSWRWILLVILALVFIGPIFQHSISAFFAVLIVLMILRLAFWVGRARRGPWWW